MKYYVDLIYEKYLHLEVEAESIQEAYNQALEQGTDYQQNDEGVEDSVNIIGIMDSNRLELVDIGELISLSRGTYEPNS